MGPSPIPNMDDFYCTDCKKPTEIVLDHSLGFPTTFYCSECGQILHPIPHYLTSESFSSDDNEDSNHVGEDSSPDAAGVFSFDAECLPTKLSRSFKAIAVMSERLGLLPTIKEKAHEIYKKVEDKKFLRGRSQDAILAACLYIACRQENKTRTVKEICSIANGTTKKDVGRAKESIVKHLEVEGQSFEMASIHAEDYMRRFCSNLGMASQEVRAAREAVLKSEELDIRRSSISVAAAIIYMIMQLTNKKKSLKDISVATGVAETTIKHSFRDIHPHLLELVPRWFAKEKDIANLVPS
ncbi:Cyclin-like family protein [Tripterygium wilfordii]|uniref:Cyclin-like family protein n=1 Tax=Tripterygium wilfordii TaxID=458696 RepID=A0A7J7CJC0_TRIWF|nr:transcription initiation factor IIB-like [Tripterygium wilfordii]KAF5734162.1 Cyclin-like family protein [Tripterygium wilfordii]